MLMVEPASDRARTRLAELLFRRRLTQADASDLAGLSRQTISHAYHGRPVSLDTWVRLANALNVSVSEIAPAEDAARIVAVT